jgi:hypothetical protein
MRSFRTPFVQVDHVEASGLQSVSYQPSSPSALGEPIVGIVRLSRHMHRSTWYTSSVLAVLCWVAVMAASPGAGAATPTYPPIEVTAPSVPPACTGPTSLRAIPGANVAGLEARLTTFVGRALAGIGQCGNGLLIVTLSPGNEHLAQRVRHTFGPSVQISVGDTVWNGHPGRSPKCGKLTPPSEGPVGYSSSLQLRSTTVKDGGNLMGAVVFRNTSRTPVRVLTDSPIEVVLTKPGTRRVVGIFDGAIAGTAYGALLSPGQTKRVDVVGGTGRCDGGLGSALPPGRYNAVAQVSGTAIDGNGGLVGSVPVTTFTQFVAIRIVRS